MERKLLYHKLFGHGRGNSFSDADGARLRDGHEDSRSRKNRVYV